MAEKIIQIIPAPPNMWAKWEPFEVGGEVEFGRIVCLALVEDNDGQRVSPMVLLEDEASIQEVFDFSNFGGIVFSTDPEKELI